MSDVMRKDNRKTLSRANNERSYQKGGKTPAKKKKAKTFELKPVQMPKPKIGKGKGKPAKMPSPPTGSSKYKPVKMPKPNVGTKTITIPESKQMGGIIKWARKNAPDIMRKSHKWIAENYPDVYKKYFAQTPSTTVKPPPKQIAPGGGYDVVPYNPPGPLVPVPKRGATDIVPLPKPTPTPAPGGGGRGFPWWAIPAGGAAYLIGDEIFGGDGVPDWQDPMGPQPDTLPGKQGHITPMPAPIVPQRQPFMV